MNSTAKTKDNILMKEMNDSRLMLSSSSTSTVDLVSPSRPEAESWVKSDTKSRGARNSLHWTCLVRKRVGADQQLDTCLGPRHVM